ncbi:peptide deformylase [filamentous cyanobacterium LEGE 11480]|uniref:Peptide deformylase n=1 Tax=Romeriopsis navalis LEGE 11480 TaxID=2777977 RepID=A0A928VIZ6_9CYAN|nr:peptide deformylase [Romeriopsis navalis]MBE9028542.1 peptide deformylase [Romeriopsis navalis LEGE 11480]
MATSSIVVEKKKLKHPPLEVHELGDKVLRQPAKRVTKIDDELRETVRKMLQTMYSQDGIGLAAPQVGIHKQLVVIDCELEDPEAKPYVLINPEIKKFGSELAKDQEGCLSVPGVFADVVRPDAIEVTYKDESGRLQKLKADGILARVIQHEIDHLNGVMFVDRVDNRLALDQELAKQGFSPKAVKPLA